MINEIKTIVQNYLNNVGLTTLMLGTVVADGIRVSEKLTIPSELIKGNLKDYTFVGDKVRLIRNHGAQEFYIVEIINKDFIVTGTVTNEGVNIIGRVIPNEEIIGNLKTRVIPGDRVRLLRDYGNKKFYMLEVIA